jgi:hypothetical protein
VTPPRNGGENWEHAFNGPSVTSDNPTDREELRRRLRALQSEHRDLDDVIARIAEQAPFDQLQIQRLKKRKLVLKDEISRLEDLLLPDIIA